MPKALDASLRDLQMDYVDLFLMHYPVAAKRGDDTIPKENGKPVTEDIDFVVVRPCSGFLFLVLKLQKKRKIYIYTNPQISKKS